MCVLNVNPDRPTKPGRNIFRQPRAWPRASAPLSAARPPMVMASRVIALLLLAHGKLKRVQTLPQWEAGVHPEEKVASPIYFWQAFRCRAVKLPLRSQRPCSPSDSVYSLSEVQTACHRPYTFLIWKERAPHSPCTTLTPQTRPNFLKWSPEYRVASPIYL